MKCEACGGDGLIEVGAYRGDEDDSHTRECRLCGGVVALETRRLAQQVVDGPWEAAPAPKTGSAAKAGRLLAQLGQAAASTGKSLLPLPDGSSYGVHEVSDAQDRAKRIAAEWNEKLRRDNELSEHEQRAAQMNKPIREL